MNDPDPLRPLEYIILAGLAVYALAAAVGIVWMLIQIARLVDANPWLLCPAAVILTLLATGIGNTKST